MRNLFIAGLFGLILHFCNNSNAATATLFVTQDTTWSGNVTMTENVIVRSGTTLTIAAGATVRMGRGISVTTQSQARITMSGTSAQPISISPLIPGTYFHNFHSKDSASFIEMDYVDVEGGQIKVSNGGTGIVQNCVLHDYNQGDNPILFVIDADSIYVNSTQVSEYYEINIVRTIALVENCLFEFPTADGIDFDNVPQGTVIRNTTVRNGRGFNIDGIDFGKVDFQPPGSIARVENCRIYNFSDNGISIGEGALDVVVMGTLIYRVGSGIAVKDSSIATIYNNTFYSCGYGIEIYEKNSGLGAGHAIAYNNIFWGNLISSVSLTTDATLQLSYSNLEDGVIDTVDHNMSLEPMFVDAATDNFELSPFSPLRLAGTNGEDLGAMFPVGGIPVPQNDLRLGHPQANMTYKGDSIIQIFWSAGDLIQTVDIDFSNDNGNTWQQLANNVTASDEGWQWTVPNIYSTKAFIRITDHNNTAKFSVNILPFKILPIGDSTDVPNVSYQSGFYSTPIDVSISAPAGSIIYYTLDGSDPTDRSPIYSTPIHFDYDSVPVGLAEQNITASDFPVQPYSYIRTSPQSVIGPTGCFWRTPNKNLTKAGVLRSRIYKPGQGLGAIVTSTFFVDPDIDTKFSLPVISLVTDPENLFNYYTGIYIPGATFTGYSFTGNYEMSGSASERPASFQFFKANGQQMLSQEVGIRIRGEWIRNYGQKALTVFARSEYDTENNFEYAFFNGLKKPGTLQSMNEFKRIILRNNGNDWLNWGNTMCKDAMIQSLFDHLKLKYQAYTPSVAFINGEYWGIHNIRELNDAWGLQKNYGIHRDSVILMEDNLDGPFKLISGKTGDEQKFIQLKDFIRQNDLTLTENFELVKGQLDIENFIDYWSATIYSNKKNTDHNQAYWKLRNGQVLPGIREGLDGRWRFMASDFDGGFLEPYFDNLSFLLGHMHDSIFARLLTNQEFRNKFILRHSDLLNSSFETQRVLDRIDDIASVIEPEMANHIGRWQIPSSMTSWYNNIEDLRNFARDRNYYQRAHLASHFGLGALHQLIVDVDDLSHGNIQVNTLFISQDLPGVSSALYPWKGSYPEGINISVTAIAKPGYRFSRWKENDQTQPTLTFNLNSDKTYTAIFVRDFSALAEDLQIFPNPATEGMIYLADYYKVSLYDITGKVIIEEQTTNQINVSQLQSGMYFLQNEIGMPGKVVVINE